MESTTAYKQKPFIVDSQHARREFTQCQNCYKSKVKHKIKLSLCTGCRVSTYCSAACQKAHWPEHKSVCMHRRQQQQRFRELDEEIRQAPPAGDDVPSSPSLLLPSEVYAELRAFTKKFNPAFFQAGFNSLHLSTEPESAQHLVLLVLTDRIPNAELPADSKPWMRFRLKFVGPAPVTFMADHLGQGGEEFIEMKKDQERQHRASGYIGTLTVCISVACPGGPILHNMSTMGFSSHSKDALKIEDGWKETLEQTIERMCGRLTDERAQDGPTRT